MRGVVLRLVLGWIERLSDQERAQIREALGPSEAEQRAIVTQAHRQLWERLLWAAR